MAGQRNENPDVRDLLGLKSPRALFVVLIFVGSFSVVAMTNLAGVRHVGPVIVAVLIVAASCCGILFVDGDPLPRLPATMISISAPVASALVLVQLSPAEWSMNQAWHLRATTAVLAYLSVRGRVGMALCGSVASCATCMTWTLATNQSLWTGFDLYSVNFGPVLMSVVFAFSIRPVAAMVFSLRSRETMRVAEQVLMKEALAERAIRMRHFESVAEPVLQLAKTQQIITSEDRLNCRIAEARLRDILRAPMVCADDGISRLIESARRRGATVMVLDDRPDREAHLETRDMHSLVAPLLEAAGPESIVTIRVLPAGREQRVSIVVTGPVGTATRRASI